MAEFTSTKLDPDTHLLLDQPLLRVPNELLRRKLKSAQRQIEITSKNMNATMRSNTTQAPSETLAILDATLAKAQNLKRKLEALQTEEKVLHVQQKARIQHMQQLHDIPNLADVKYDRWSQTRLDRLLVDYLLRQGYTKSAKELAREKRIEDLVDLTLFEECGKIEQSLREGRMQECLTWCMENKQALKKMNVSTAARAGIENATADGRDRATLNSSSDCSNSSSWLAEERHSKWSKPSSTLANISQPDKTTHLSFRRGVCWRIGLTPLWSATG